MKKLVVLFSIILLISFVSSFSLSLTPQSLNHYIRNTNFQFQFDFSQDSSCSTIDLTNSTSGKTDDAGRFVTSINISSLTSVPSYLCYTIDSREKVILPFSDIIFNKIFAKEIVTNSINSTDWSNVSINGNQVVDDGTYINWTIATNGTLALNSSLSNYFLTSNWNSTNSSYMTFGDWNATNESYRTLDNLTFEGNANVTGNLNVTGEINSTGLNVDGNIKLTNNNLIGNSTSIADDSVVSFTPGAGNGIIFVYYPGGATSFSGMVLYRTAGSDITTLMLDVNGNMEVSTSILTGTTGTDGKFTVSASGTTIYLENRLGGTDTVGWVILGGS